MVGQALPGLERNEAVNNEAKVNSNIVWQPTQVTREDREQALKQRGRVVWFTGLSGSGKSTVAVEVERRLVEAGRATYLLDGDNLRFGLNKDLSFSESDRRENIRRIAEVAKLFADAGLIVLAAFISPYREDREALRQSIGEGRFIEVSINTPLSVCEARDTKGLYAKARAGEISDFTGISAPYEEPENPEIAIDTSQVPLDEAAQSVIRIIEAGMDEAFRLSPSA